MTLEIERFNLEGNLAGKHWVHPGKKILIPQYLGDRFYYYQVYCARNNTYSSIETVFPAQYAVVGNRRIPMAAREGKGIVVLKPGDVTKPLPIRAEENGLIEHYRFSLKGPKIDLSRKKR